jgi:sugar O-acyltransferase (sialic acid O-acetyltransferase NeuD family)
MAQSKEQIAIYGAGGFAREVAWLAEQCRDGGSPYELVALIDDNAANHGRVINDLVVRGLEQTYELFPGAKVVGGIGSPVVRQKVMAKAAARGFGTLSLVHPSVLHSRWVEIGEGAVICAGNILTTNIRLGRHVQINLDCTVGHDVVFDDFVTLAPGAHISGCVQLRARVYVGTGAVIINGTEDNPIVIGEDAVIGAGACVTKSVAPGLTVVGVPAKARTAS